MPIRDDSSVWVSLRCLRSCRILRPTSWTCRIGTVDEIEGSGAASICQTGIRWGLGGVILGPAGPPVNRYIGRRSRLHRVYCGASPVPRILLLRHAPPSLPAQRAVSATSRAVTPGPSSASSGPLSSPCGCCCSSPSSSAHHAHVAARRAHRELGIFLFAGLVPWMAVQEGLQRASGAITDNAELVRKLSFPSEILVLTVVLAALLHEAIALGLFIVVLAVFGELAPCRCRGCSSRCRCRSP